MFSGSDKCGPCSLDMVYVIGLMKQLEAEYTIRVPIKTAWEHMAIIIYRYDEINNRVWSLNGKAYTWAISMLNSTILHGSQLMSGEE